MDLSDILLRHLDTQGAVYSPVVFDGDWDATEQAQIRALIAQQDGAAVGATYNNWQFWCHADARYIRRYTWRRATWDRFAGADTLDGVLAQLRRYYGGA